VDRSWTPYQGGERGGHGGGKKEKAREKTQGKAHKNWGHPFKGSRTVTRAAVTPVWSNLVRVTEKKERRDLPGGVTHSEAGHDLSTKGEQNRRREMRLWFKSPQRRQAKVDRK